MKEDCPGSNSEPKVDGDSVPGFIRITCSLCGMDDLLPKVD